MEIFGRRTSGQGERGSSSGVGVSRDCSARLLEVGAWIERRRVLLHCGNEKEGEMTWRYSDEGLDGEGVDRGIAVGVCERFG